MRSLIRRGWLPFIGYSRDGWLIGWGRFYWHVFWGGTGAVGMTIYWRTDD